MYDYRLEGYLKEAVLAEDASTINRIIRSNILPRSRMAFYFHTAVQNGLLESVRALLAGKVVHVDHVNVDFSANGKVTALHEAVILGRTSMVKLLLVSGANLEIEAIFPFCRAKAVDLAVDAGFERIVEIINSFKRWLCGKLHESVEYLTETRNYVLTSKGRNVHTGLAETRLEFVDELIEFCKTVRYHIGAIQKHWKLLEAVYQRTEILRLMDEATKCIQILVEHHKLTEIEMRIYESRIYSAKV